MGYFVGQIRKNAEEPYMTSVPVTRAERYTPNPFGDASKPYKDFALEGNFEQGKTYYLRFKIRRIPQYYYSGIAEGSSNIKIYNNKYQLADSLNITVRLETDAAANFVTNPEGQYNQDWLASIQQIGTCYVPTAIVNEESAGEEGGEIVDKCSSFIFVFTPVKANMHYITFKIHRGTYDAIENEAANGRQGRTWLLDSVDQEENSSNEENENVSNESDKYQPYSYKSGQSQNEQIFTVKVLKKHIYYENPDGQVAELKDLVSESFKDTSIESKKWIKLGYQSRPGNLIVVNQQPIRVGRSGIYQLNSGLPISKFMITAPRGSEDPDGNNYIDSFLLDYAYES